MGKNMETRNKETLILYQQHEKKIYAILNESQSFYLIQDYSRGNNFTIEVVGATRYGSYIMLDEKTTEGLEVYHSVNSNYKKEFNKRIEQLKNAGFADITKDIQTMLYEYFYLKINNF